MKGLEYSFVEHFFDIMKHPDYLQYLLKLPGYRPYTERENVLSLFLSAPGFSLFIHLQYQSALQASQSPYSFCQSIQLHTTSENLCLYFSQFPVRSKRSVLKYLVYMQVRVHFFVLLKFLHIIIPPLPHSLKGSFPPSSLDLRTRLVCEIRACAADLFWCVRMRGIFVICQLGQCTAAAKPATQFFARQQARVGEEGEWGRVILVSLTCLPQRWTS